jgi:hypothetical protein
MGSPGGVVDATDQKVSYEYYIDRAMRTFKREFI